MTIFEKEDFIYPIGRVILHEIQVVFEVLFFLSYPTVHMYRVNFEPTRSSCAVHRQTIRQNGTVRQNKQSLSSKMHVTKVRISSVNLSVLLPA